jgi:hypothetical protein
MLRPLSFLCSTTQSTAAMTWVMSVAPAASAAFSDTIRASGGHPEEVDAVPDIAAADGVGAAAGDDPGHVGAVPVGVQVGQLRDLGLE